MRGLGRRTGWLGWAVAGVLLLSAGGVALAAQGSPTTTQPPGATADKERAGLLGRGPGWRQGGLARRALHGELTLQTRDGVKTVVVARGEVTALAGDSITVKSSDGVSTSFRINGDTRFGFLREPDPRAELKVGDTVFVAGTKSGDTVTATRVVSAKDLPERARQRANP
jgi:Domain of unknown function (DUF5666)